MYVYSVLLFTRKKDKDVRLGKYKDRLLKNINNDNSNKHWNLEPSYLQGNEFLKTCYLSLSAGEALARAKGGPGDKGFDWLDSWIKFLSDSTLVSSPKISTG